MSSRQVTVPLCAQPLRWVIVVGVAMTILILSLVPPPTDVQSTGQADKLLHFIAYFGLAGALTYATIELQSRLRLRSLFIFVGATGFGLAIELLQGNLPYRFFTAGDIAANAVGAGLMVLLLPLERYIKYCPLGDYLSQTRQ